MIANDSSLKGPSTHALDEGDTVGGGPLPCLEEKLSDTCDGGGKTVLSPTNSFIEEISCLGDSQEESGNMENEAQEEVEEQRRGRTTLFL